MWNCRKIFFTLCVENALYFSLHLFVMYDKVLNRPYLINEKCQITHMVKLLIHLLKNTKKRLLTQQQQFFPLKYEQTLKPTASYQCTLWLLFETDLV